MHGRGVFTSLYALPLGSVSRRQPFQRGKIAGSAMEDKGSAMYNKAIVAFRYKILDKAMQPAIHKALITEAAM